MWRKKTERHDEKREVAIDKNQRSISEAVSELVKGIQELQAINKLGEPGARER